MLVASADSNSCDQAGAQAQANTDVSTFCIHEVLACFSLCCHATNGRQRSWISRSGYNSNRIAPCTAALAYTVFQVPARVLLVPGIVLLIGKYLVRSFLALCR